ncbi:MAG: peptide chain release factor 1 [Spirochaetota bacterium]
MLEKLAAVERRYNEIIAVLSDAATAEDSRKVQALMKEKSELEDIVIQYRAIKSVDAEIAGAGSVLAGENDAELKNMAEEELIALRSRRTKLFEEVQFLLIPKDKNDGKNIIVEIRGGTGGEESALFAADLFRMYARYAERKGFTVEVIDRNVTEIGGLKEIVFSVTGKDVYKHLKFESGTHRVQRVPKTEAQGRIHTSAATVAVLAEAEETDIVVRTEDLRIDVMRSGGAGGQHVNKTESAVRMTHIPTGIVVLCQDQKSQIKNRARAMAVMRAKLFEKEESERKAKEASDRKSQVGSGDRSEKIRTYNFPQNRVTDHRIDFTAHNLDIMLDGALDDLIDALLADERARLLAEYGTSR